LDPRRVQLRGRANNPDHEPDRKEDSLDRGSNKAEREAALVGASLAAGEPDLALGALGRFVISATLVVAAGVLVAGLKQILVHRRKPMVMGSRGRVRRLRGAGPNAPGS
jgi:hypothetical protein